MFNTNQEEKKKSKSKSPQGIEFWPIPIFPCAAPAVATAPAIGSPTTATARSIKASPAGECHWGFSKRWEDDGKWKVGRLWLKHVET